MIPGITVITDIMVGFCGETQDDFEQTVSLVRELEFEDINVFRFSMRSGTKAAALYKDDVSDEEKMRRYDIIRAIRDDIKSRKLSAIIGTDLTVVIEGRNRAGQMYGRDRNHRTVVVDQCAGLEYNDIVDVRVEKVVDGYLCGSLAD
jgi:tRNA-2-methylthio-N6-dimethylallyladenosine synthase